MTHSLFSDSAVVLQSLLLGLFLGFLFEAFRFLRAITPTLTALVFFEDLLYWVLFSAFSLLFFTRVSSGSLALFPAAAVFLGFLIFLFTLGRLFTRLRTRLITPLKRKIILRLQMNRTRELRQKRKSLNIFNKIKRKIIFFKKSPSKKKKNDI